MRLAVDSFVISELLVPLLFSCHSPTINFSFETGLSIGLLMKEDVWVVPARAKSHFSFCRMFLSCGI